MKRVLVIAAFCCLWLSAIAQQITVHAPSAVGAGQNFRVSFDINGDTRDFREPDWGGLEVVSGPSTSHSSSMSWVNGKSESSTRTTYSFILAAPKEGTYTVGRSSCSVDGHKIVGSGFTVKAEKGTPQAQPQAAGRSRGNQGPAPRQQAQQSNSDASSFDKSQLYARALLSKSNPYEGEEVIITYKIYSRVDLDRVNYSKAPEKKGFWAEDLTGNGNVTVKQETVNGKPYNVYTIQQEALFAQESGRLTIEPYELPARAVTYPQEPIQTPFGIIGYRTVARAIDTKLRTNSIVLNVKPLPEAPADFSGAIGKFSVKSSADLTEVRANEAITFTLTVSGHGNLPLLDAPTVDFPPVFEVYEPKVEDHISRSCAGVGGSRTFEWVLIPRSQGNYEIPAISYTYFDPKTGHYATATAHAIPVKVHKGDPNAMKNVSSKNDVKLLNSDINYIKRKMHSSQGDSLNVLHVLLLLLPPLLAIVAVVLGRKRQTMLQDEKGMRLRRATRMARKRLRKAEQHLKSGESEPFYEEIYKALWGCLSDKFGIELSQLSRDSVEEKLVEKHVSEELLGKVMRTLADVDYARFAPGDSSSKMQAIYEEALNLVIEI